MVIILCVYLYICIMYVHVMCMYVCSQNLKKTRNIGKSIPNFPIIIVFSPSMPEDIIVVIAICFIKTSLGSAKQHIPFFSPFLSQTSSWTESARTTSTSRTVILQMQLVIVARSLDVQVSYQMATELNITIRD